MRKIRNFMYAFILIALTLGSSYYSTKIGSIFAESNSATEFVTTVAVETTSGPITSNKISDSSAIKVTYNLDIGLGNNVDILEPYTMTLPSELSYETTNPIELRTIVRNIYLGNVTIVDNIISVQFDSNVKDLDNVKINFSFWSNFNKSLLDYTAGNDLAFPTKTKPLNTVHINFSKSSSGGGSGTSAVSKNLNYSKEDPTIVNWTITINNGGYEIFDSIFVDIFENDQTYIEGSASVTYRNWDKDTLSVDTTDLIFIDNNDGTHTLSENFGYLTPAFLELDDEVTSILIRYQTKLTKNDNNKSYKNVAYSYDGTELIDQAPSTASYRGDTGGGEGDLTKTITGTLTWQDEDNIYQTRPNDVTIELLQNDVVYDSVIIEDTSTIWDYTFIEVPVYDLDEVEYNYSTRIQTPVPSYMLVQDGYDFTLTYTKVDPEPEMMYVDGIIQWIDDNNLDSTRPQSITVELLQRGLVIDTVTIPTTTNNTDAYSFKNLPKTSSDGEEHIYTTRIQNPITPYTLIQEGYDFTLTYTSKPTIPERTHIKGHIVWIDDNNAHNTRPNVLTIELLQNGTLYQEQDVSIHSLTNTWSYDFSEIPIKDENNEVYIYTIQVKNLPASYTYTFVDNILTLKYISPTTPTSPTTTLPKTGMDSLLPLIPGGMLINMGGLLIFLKRKD